MQTVEWFMWLIALASLVGTVLNIRHAKSCFVIWFFCNISWTIYDIHKEAYSQAALMAIYAVLAVYGYRHWTKGDYAKKTTPRRKCRGWRSSDVKLTNKTFKSPKCTVRKIQ